MEPARLVDSGTRDEAETAYNDAAADPDYVRMERRAAFPRQYLRCLQRMKRGPTLDKWKARLLLVELAAGAPSHWKVLFVDGSIVDVWADAVTGLSGPEDKRDYEFGCLMIMEPELQSNSRSSRGRQAIPVVSRYKSPASQERPSRVSGRLDRAAQLARPTLALAADRALQATESRVVSRDCDVATSQHSLGRTVMVLWPV